MRLPAFRAFWLSCLFLVGSNSQLSALAHAAGSLAPDLPQAASAADRFFPCSLEMLRFTAIAVGAGRSIWYFWTGMSIKPEIFSTSQTTRAQSEFKDAAMLISC